MRPRTAALWVLAAVVTVVFGYFAVRDARPDEVWEALRESNVLWLVPAIALLALGTFARAVRWWSLFGRGTRPPLGPVTASMLVGLALNNLLPLRAGEAARILALGRRTGVSRVEILATVARERALDVFCLIVLLFAALPWLPDVDWLRPAAVLAFVIALGLIALAVVGERPFHALARRSERLEHAWHSASRGLVGLRDPRIAFAGFAWTMASWVLIALSFWVVTLSFDLGLSATSGVLVLSAVGLALVLPAAPASLGVFEAATVLALAAYDVPRSEALSYAFVLHAVNLFPYVLAGAVALRFTRPPR